MNSRRVVGWVLFGLLAYAARPFPGRAFASAAVGDRVADAELPTLDGGRHRLLRQGARVNVLVFFRPEQDHSLDTLQDLAACERELRGKPVHFVAVVSGSWPAAEVRAFVARAGVAMPVLVDEGDALYGRIGVRLHPSIGVLDGTGRLLAYEPFRAINYGERVRARIRRGLGEITDAEVAAVENPARSETRSEDGVARRHVQYARSLLRVKKPEAALAEAEKGLAVAPSAEAYAVQGQALAAMGRCAEAVRAFEAALKLEPAHAVAQEGRRSCGR